MTIRTNKTLDRRAEPIREAAALSIDEFCWSHGICRATFYNLLKRGEAPRVMRVGHRTLISVEAAADWRREREAA